MGRSVEAKRRQRRLQKRKKRLKKFTQSQKTSSPDLFAEASDIEVEPSSSRSSETACQVATSSSTSVLESHINELITKVSGGELSLPVSSSVSWEQYERVQLQLHEASRDIRCYKRAVKEEKKRAIAVEKECQRRVKSVRSFWRDKIYREGCRTGKILKLAMQGRQQCS